VLLKLNQNRLTKGSRSPGMGGHNENGMGVKMLRNIHDSLQGHATAFTHYTFIPLKNKGAPLSLPTHIRRRRHYLFFAVSLT